MSVALKAGLVLVVGAGGMTVTYLVTSKSAMPNWEPIPSGSHTGKYAADYLKFLVYASEGKNEDWWNWSYQYKYNIQGKNWEDGFSKTIVTDKTKLREACEKAYGGNATVSEGKISEGSNKYKEEDVWKLCSQAKEKPRTLEQFKDKSEEEKNKLSGAWKDKLGEQNKAHLLSIADQDNSWVWDIIQKKFMSENENKDSNKFFSRPTDSSTNIRHKCSEAYEKDKSTTSGTATAPTKEDVLKWCSLKGKE